MCFPQWFYRQKFRTRLPNSHRSLGIRTFSKTACEKTLRFPYFPESHLDVTPIFIVVWAGRYPPNLMFIVVWAGRYPPNRYKTMGLDKSQRVSFPCFSGVSKMALERPQTDVLGNLFGGSRGGTQRVKIEPHRRPPNPLFYRADGARCAYFTCLEGIDPSKPL